jgi:predicted RNA-binding protein with PIN domain
VTRLLIDGYNFLPATGFSTRDKLLDALAKYRQGKGCEVTIVFDGTHGGTGFGERTAHGGVEIIFTPLTVTADDRIEEILEDVDANATVVVSTDRRVRSAATRVGATSVTSDEFAKKLHAALSSRPQEPAQPIEPWMEGRTDEHRTRSNRPRPGKKLSKEERRRKQKLGRL